MPTRLHCALTFALLLVASAAHGEDVTFYVAPGGNDGASGRSAQEAFATPQRAQAAVRQWKEREGEAGAATVLFGASTYVLTEPLRFGPEDSGSAAAPVTYAAAPGANAVLSGGQRIEGWQKDEQGRWFVDLAEVKAGRWHFRQLFVNGEKRARARTPNEGLLARRRLPGGDAEDSELPHRLPDV